MAIACFNGADQHAIKAHYSKKKEKCSFELHTANLDKLNTLSNIFNTWPSGSEYGKTLSIYDKSFKVARSEIHSFTCLF